MVIVAGVPALLTTEILPFATPEDVGAKIALNDVLDPALIVIGIVGPLTLYPGPDADNCVTVRAAFPGFDTETVCDMLLPTDSLPKLMLVGLTVI
jgi:hypothetical protein